MAEPTIICPKCKNEIKLPVHEVGMPWKFVVSEIDAWVQTGNAGRKYALNRWRPDGLAAEGAMRQ